MHDPLRVVDLGRIRYAEAYELQQRELESVLADREAGRPRVGTLFLLEHEPVVTVSRRATAASHVVGTPELFARLGVEVRETDRGGDVTYHGPGQLVGYAVLDLNLLGMGIHEHMRLLEQAVIDAAGTWGVQGHRDPEATGVWVDTPTGGPAAKLCAFGVRVRRWVTMHGLGLNVDPDMSHFGLIVPCGLAGRPVTSLRALLGTRAPGMSEVKARVAEALGSLLSTQMETTASRRGA